jgi:hypothetical protein
MNKIFITILSAVVFSSCSTAYKAGQTPDDVYFSPSLNRSEYVVMDEEDGYRAEDVPMDDRYLRMKSMRRNRWSAFDDDYMYWNDPRWNSLSYFNTFPSYGRMGMMGMGMNSFFNPYYMNPFSNMYYGQPFVIYNINNYNPKMLYSRPRSTGPRMANMNLPAPVRVSNYNPKMLELDTRSGRSYINSGGSTPRGGYNPVNTSSMNGNPVRTFNSGSNSDSRFSSGSSSSGSSNGSSSGSSGSAPVRSFPRGGGGL